MGRAVQPDTYERLTPALALGLACPRTWAASILPVLLGAALSVGRGDGDRWALLLPMLAAVMLMQSAVNTLNDYADFRKETDTPENCDDPSDAVLVYHRLKPLQVLGLGGGFLAAAGILALPVVLGCGPAPLLIGLCGGLCVVCYSLGGLPLSYFPVGEVISGFVMGGLIPLAVVSALTGETDPSVLAYALPLILGIGLIMLTNNICDIERDTKAGRTTLAVLLGRKRAAALYRTLAAVWFCVLAWLVLFRFPGGGLLLVPALMGGGAAALRQLRLPLTPERRGTAMGGIARLNLWLGLGYGVAVLVHRLLE